VASDLADWMEVAIPEGLTVFDFPPVPPAAHLAPATCWKGSIRRSNAELGSSEFYPIHPHPQPPGHQEGAVKISSVAETWVAFGIQVLTLDTFSTENWSRPT